VSSISAPALGHFGAAGFLPRSSHGRLFHPAGHHCLPIAIEQVTGVARKGPILKSCQVWVALVQIGYGAETGVSPISA